MSEQDKRNGPDRKSDPLYTAIGINESRKWRGRIASRERRTPKGNVNLLRAIVVNRSSPIANRSDGSKRAVCERETGDRGSPSCFRAERTGTMRNETEFKQKAFGCILYMPVSEYIMEAKNGPARTE